MFRRRRRSTVRFAGRGGRGGGGRGLLVLLGAGAAVLIGFSIYLVNVADGVDPDRHETRIELPHAFDD